MRTVFAMIPSAAAAGPVIAAMKALRPSRNARLVGIHVTSLVPAYGLVGDMALAAYIEAQAEAMEKERTAAKAAFASVCEAAGVAFEWRTASALEPSFHAGAIARAADLVVCWQTAGAAPFARLDIADVVSGSGRPVLALPENWRGNEIGKRVLAAWDGGREATRAVFDAMPFLVAAEAVRLVSVEGFQQDPVRQFTPADDIAATLARHGVKVEASTFGSTRGSVREALGAQALDFGADLLVMGCYGHSRFRQRILGGVTRDMLASLPLPLLLSS
jgi:nucleotide-binding universal stress UspA family protein